MSFHETRINDGLVIFETVGGPAFSTDVVKVKGGGESRNGNWDESLAVFELGERVVNRAELDALIAFFRARKGRLYGFRFKDWADFAAAIANGRLGTGAVGTGTPAYALWKRYTEAGAIDDKRIWKPRSGTVTLYRAGSPVTLGAGAGQASIDFTTGTATFVADASAAVTGHTVGGSHQFTTATDPGLAIGQKVYLSGVTGTAAATLNAVAHTINNKTGAGPYTWTIAAGTAGLTATGGTAYKYPQATESLTWAGEFDLPVRFDVDQLRYQFKAYDAASGEALFYLFSLLITEPRLS